MTTQPTRCLFRRLRARVCPRAIALPAVLALAAFAANTHANPNAPANLLVGGDFEGITGPLAAYPAPAIGFWASESAALTGAANGITPFGSSMLQLNHAGGGGAAQTNQVVYGPFKAGSVVTFAAKFNTWVAASATTPQTVAVSIMTDSGVALTGTRYTSPTVALDTNTSTWQTASVTVTLPADTNYISAEIILWMYSGALPYGTPLAYVDDAVLTVAPHINWVNWTGTETVSGITKYVGNMVVPRTSGGSTTVTVKYTPPNQVNGGNGYPGVWNYQTSNGADYFAQGNAGSLGRSPAWSPYTSAKVGNIPDGGGAASDWADIIELRYAGTNKLEFFDASTGQPIAIASPVFAYVSLNGNGYGFDQDFDILSYGDGVDRDQGYFGAGSSKKVTAVVGSATQYQLLQDTNPLGGGEPHGALQFRGAFSTVSWQSLSNEVWNGFTIGVAQLAADVPIANAGPDQTVNATSLSGASVQLAGSVSGSTNAPFTYSWSGDFGFATGPSPVVNLSIGTHTITLNVTDATGASDSDTVVITVVLPPAPVITSANTASGTYGSPFTYTITATNSPTSFGAVGLPAGLTLNGAVISGTPTQTGTFGIQLSAANLGGTGTGLLMLTVAKVNATVVVTPYNVTYDGNAHTATVAITGINGETGAAVGIVAMNSTHTDAGTYSDSWTFTPSSHYNALAGGTVSDVIAKANATVTVNGYTGTYDGAAHGATGTATGLGGANLSAGLNLGTTFTNAPGGTASWTFAGGTNYNDASGTAAIVINKANATVAVTPYSVTYDAAAHSATVASVTGVNGETGATVGTVTLATTHTDAGTYSDSWSFTGGTNYNDIAATAISDAIAKANATVSVTGYTGTFDGAAHGASGSATGVGGVSLGGLNLGATFTNGPGGTAHWTFTGGTNYKDQSGDAAIVINKANATVSVSGYSGTFDGAAHGASGSATGVGSANLNGSLNLGATFTNGPGGTAHWTFTGGTNYVDQSGDVGIVINKANATVAVASYTGTYDGIAHGATGTATGVGGANLSASLNLGATFTNAPGGTAHWTFTGGTNYNDQSGDAAIVINKANATIVVTPYNVEYDAHAHSATVASITGVHGETGATVGSVALNTTHTAVGTYADSWTFTGAANYNNIGATAITDVIKDTTPPVVTATMTSRGGGDDESTQFFTIVFTATDLVGVKTLTATLNGVTVTNGQIVQLQTIKSGAQSVKRDDGKLQIKATSFKLTVVATDAAGNSTTSTVVPVFVKNGKDSEDKGSQGNGQSNNGNDQSDDKKGDH